jgi:hypothetical protein
MWKRRMRRVGDRVSSVCKCVFGWFDSENHDRVEIQDSRPVVVHSYPIPLPGPGSLSRSKLAPPFKDRYYGRQVTAGNLPAVLPGLGLY